MTRRERKEARLARRLEWAEGRDKKAAEAFNKAQIISDGIPFGQPILVGHHSEAGHRRDLNRIESGMRQGVESAKMADHHRSKADGIQAQLDHSIFSDDPDAPERLRERIAELEAEREMRKLANRAYKAGGEAAMRTAVSQDIADVGVQTLKFQPYYKMPYPPYSISNIGANIRRLQKRLEEICTPPPTNSPPSAN